MYHGRKSLIGWTALAAVVALAGPISAQECKINRVGGPNRFAAPSNTVADMKAMYRDKRSEIDRQLSALGWAGDPKDLADAVAQGGAVEKSLPTGTHFDWMLMRKKGVAQALRDDCWGGKKALSVWAFDVVSRGRRWHFVVPKACSNLALTGSEAMPSAPPPPGAKALPAPAPESAPAPPPAPPPPEPPPVELPVEAPRWNFEIFAGYFLPEELDEDLAYGLRFGRRGTGNWGWQLGASWFDVADSQGFSGRTVDADVVHLDFSLAYYPGAGNFSIFFGPGFASGNVDVPGTATDLSDDVFTAHVGLGYEFDISDSFYVKPDFRARYYEMEGFARDGGRQSQLTYEAAFALGWRFGGD